MKRLIIFFVSIILILPAINFAQLKIGYVDSNTILKELPDAQDAQKTIDALVQEWKDELQKMQKELDAKSADFEKRKLIMSDNKRLEVEPALHRSPEHRSVQYLRHRSAGRV